MCCCRSKEIVVRIEYKFCPNLTIIDTPGAAAALFTLSCCCEVRKEGPCTLKQSAVDCFDTTCCCIAALAGLISAAPGKRNSSLQNSAKQVRSGKVAGQSAECSALITRAV